ncbi:restriction endonuclease subunit S [Aliarcobacter cryaerophilus]|uniref:restriction endonuclease subunit S n=1 Tax=Aliarcobacter cryaerophilus TaxID=28198 RepID=UPI0021B57D27|nr:restriction endonuclease subunit S [Aliarcobacter cryaerophilus]MCT7469298.1 restriction endonuclease subunit S [Aliarcobacter cryaerophilus]
MKYRVREQNELKPSGVEWLGDIPKDWKKGKIKYYLSLVSGIFTQKTDFGLYNLYGANGVIGVTDNYNINEKSIIIGRVGSAGYINEAEKESWISDNALIVKIKNQNNYRYIYYLLKSLNLNRFASFNAQPLISATTINNLEVFIPTVITQQKIANFLDEKSKIFDEAISKKEQLISKLELAKQSLISEVVTGKLKVVEQSSKLQTIKREKNELKPSGVEWLGDIPKDWKLTKLKYLGDAIIGLTYSPTDVVDKNEGKLVLRSSNVQNKRITFEDNVYVKSEIPKKLLTKIDDILICSRNGSRNLIGKNALITENSQDLTFGAFMTLFRSKYNKYLFYIFNSDIFEAQSASFLSSTINQLTTGNLNNFKIVLPSLEEQQKISKYLDEKLIHFDNTIEKTKQSITKLKEAKEALISQVVTGKIEVL